MRFMEALQLSRLTERQKELARAIGGIFAFAAFMLIVTFAVGKPLMKTIGDPETFRAWVDGHGALGRLAFVGMMAMQIVIAFIPGEPLEIAAGYAFGPVEGTALCMLGALIGGTAVFLAVRRFGQGAAELFFSEKTIRKAAFMNNPERLNAAVFLLFFLPGTPKDLLTYCVGLTKMKLGTWMLITSLARFPSIITSTVGGSALGVADYMNAAIVFGATFVVSAAGLYVYRRLGTPRPSNTRAVKQD